MKAIKYPKSAEQEPILSHYPDPQKFLKGVSKFESAACLAEDISTRIQ